MRYAAARFGWPRSQGTGPPPRGVRTAEDLRRTHHGGRRSERSQRKRRTVAMINLADHVMVFHAYPPRDCPGIIITTESGKPGKVRLQCAECHEIVGEMDHDLLAQ